MLDFDEKRYEQALDNLRRALEAEPAHREALYYTGVVHMARGRPEQAIPFLERALAQSGDKVPIMLQLGLAHFARQDFDRAQPLLERVFRADRTSMASATTSAPLPPSAVDASATPSCSS